MMHDMMSGMTGSMMWGMGLIGLLLAVALALAIIALAKFIFRGRR